MKHANNAYAVSMLLSAMAVFAGCTGPVTQSPAVERNMAMIRAYVDAANRGDDSYLDEYLAPDYVYHGARGDLDADGFKHDPR